jgi:hypothetical protein
MVILFAFFINFLAAQNQTQATEATVVSHCDESIPGVVCIQKYQSRTRVSDEAKNPDTAHEPSPKTENPR